MDTSPPLRRYALLITALASFLAPFMSSSINLAIRAMGEDLARADAITLPWVVTIYLLAAAATLIPIGRLADLQGRKRVFVAGLLLHGLSSALAAAAQTVEQMILLRALQGIGGAAVFATGVAILTSVYPPAERGRVLGINAMAVYSGLSMGPVLGGYLTDTFGWPAIFVLNAVVALGIVPLTLFKLQGEWKGAAGERFDWIGALIYGPSLVAAIYGISSIREVGYAPWLIGGGVVGLILFVALEMRLPEPLLDLGHFGGNISFTFSNLAALIHYSATFAITFLLSLYLQVAQGLPARRAGLILLAQPVMMALLSPLAGWLSDRVQPRRVASLGMGLMAGGLFVLSTFHQATWLGWVVTTLLFMGTGFALFSSPNTNAVMSSVPARDYGLASSTLGTMRLIGQTMSMAIVQLLFSIYLGETEITAQVAAPFLQAMQVGFRIFAALAAVGIAASLARGKVQR